MVYSFCLLQLLALRSSLCTIMVTSSLYLISLTYLLQNFGDHYCQLVLINHISVFFELFKSIRQCNQIRSLKERKRVGGITKAVKKHKGLGNSLEEKDYSNILWWKEVL